MSDELTDDVISQWLEVAAPCLFAAWQYGQTPDDADPVAWFAEVYGQGAPGPVHAVHVIGDDGRTVAVTGNGPRSAAHAKFLAWSSPGNVSKLLCDFRSMRTRALAAERLLADERAAHAETLCELDALLTALGAQVTPGGQTLESCHARRVADGMRRARELVAAREVPPDVEAAIRAAIDGAVASGEARALGHASLLTGEPFYTEPRLRAAIAKAIADAEERGRADSAAAPHDVEVAISDLVAASRDLEVYAAGKVTAKRTKSAEAEFGRSRTALRAAIAAEIERGRATARAEFDHSRSVFFNDMLRRRDVKSPCQECDGYGVVAYPSTATWHRGAGGQMSTYDVCSRCWGSGDEVKRGVDLRRLGAEIERARAEGRGESPAAPVTVGGLLATAPAIEYADGNPPRSVAAPSWWQVRNGQVRQWWQGRWHTIAGGSISSPDLPARLVPASEADADPASRGPIGGGS